MKKRLWKQILVAGCVSTLLMTSPGMLVFADEFQGGEISPVDVIGESLTFADDTSAALVNTAESDRIVVGDGITATFDEAAGEVVLYSDDGTLWKDWIAKSGLDSDKIKEIRAAETSGKVYLPSDSSYMFYYFNNLTSLDLSMFDTSNVTNMSSLFEGCRRLTSLDLSGFDTSKVINMNGMFESCESLTELDLSSFNTSNVVKMGWMFCYCYGLTDLDLTGFDTSKVTYMWMMFHDCKNLRHVDVSSFNTSRVTEMARMFDGCSSLTSLDVSNFDTSNVESIGGMFNGCSSLTSLNVSGFDLSKVTARGEWSWGLGELFSDCSSLKSLDLSKFNTSNVEHMAYMFSGCSSLTSLDLRSFNTSNVESMKAMFKGCTSLKELDMSSFDMLNIVDEGESSYYLGLGDIFADCDSLEILRTPKSNKNSPNLPLTMYDKEGNTYNALPAVSKSIVLASSRQLAVETSKEIKFTDVFDKTSWYYDSVYWAVENNVTSGMGEGTFQPMAKLSRAQAVTFLYNLAGRPDVSKLQAKEFTDVSKTAWYYNAVKWAVANKITSGYGTGTFQPNATCNRAMIVTFLANYAKAAGTYKEPTTSASFKDVKAKDWFKKSVDWAVENGITSGYGQGTFSPNVTCNRAMMVTFLKKVAELAER